MTLEIISRSIVISLLIKAAGGGATRACARSLGLLALMCIRVSNVPSQGLLGPNIVQAGSSHLGPRAT